MFIFSLIYHQHLVFTYTSIYHGSHMQSIDYLVKILFIIQMDLFFMICWTNMVYLCIHLIVWWVFCCINIILHGNLQQRYLRHLMTNQFLVFYLGNIHVLFICMIRYPIIVYFYHRILLQYNDHHFYLLV